MDHRRPSTPLQSYTSAVRVSAGLSLRPGSETRTCKIVCQVAPLQGCAVSCNGPVFQEWSTLFHENKKYFHFIFLTVSSLFRNTLNQLWN